MGKVPTSLQPTCLLIRQQSQRSSQESSGIIQSTRSPVAWLATSVSKPTPQTASNCRPPRQPSVPPPPPQPSPGPGSCVWPRWAVDESGVCLFSDPNWFADRWRAVVGLCGCDETLVPSLETFQAYVTKNCSACGPTEEPLPSHSGQMRWLVRSGCCGFLIVAENGR